MSIFTKLAGIGSRDPVTNCSQMIEVDDDDLLVQMPKSKYMLKCREEEEDRWKIDIIDPYTMDSVPVHESLSTEHFQSLLFNLFSVQLPDIGYHAVKDMYKSLH